MANYKVLQDIESEDKLFGPFTLKQFIFGFVAIALALLMVRIGTLPMPPMIKFPIIFVILPFFAILAFLAAPIGRDQPNDVWLIAQLRFLFKPRVRIWSQEGMSELVTITVPKKIEKVLTNNFTQNEVKSRLNALASTLDSRGWAVKNVNANMYSQPSYLSDGGDSDRLVATVELPQEVARVEVLASDDMFDASNSSRIANLDKLMEESATATKKRALDSMSQAANPASQSATQTPQDYWFMNNPSPSQQPAVPTNFSTFQASQVIAPGTTDQVAPAADETKEEKELAHKLVEDKKEDYKINTEHMKVINPIHDRDGNLTTPPVSQPNPVGAVPAETSITPAKAMGDDLLPDEMPGATQITGFVKSSQLDNQVQPVIEEKTQTAPQPQQETPSPAIQTLAINNDLNLSTLSREAKRAEDDGEVVINLH